MNQKEFIQRSDEILNSMSTDKLRRCLHNISRKTPETKRESFLQTLEDCCGQDDQKDSEAKVRYKKLMPDERVQERLSDIKSKFIEIENADLCISAQGYEDYSNGYWADNWIWEYEDNEGIGSIIEDAVIFAHDCMNDCRYKEAVEIFNLVMETQISFDAESVGGASEFSLEEMVDEKLAGINLKVLALDVLYSNYQLQIPDQRASVLYSYFTYPYFKDIRVEDIFSVGREELTGTNDFFESWIDFLLQQSGEIAARLLKEGILYYKGTEGLLEMARKGYKEHPSVYLAVLLEYEKNHDYEKMKDVGEEALDNIDSDLKIRGEIALKAAQASCCIGDEEFMRKCLYEAFYSNSTVPNYLRLFPGAEAILEYKESAQKKIGRLNVSGRYNNHTISETDLNNILEFEYKYLCFFSGHFDKIKNWCMEQKSPLGWSGNFIGYGVDLMLLYLYADLNLRNAGKKIAARISNEMGFNEKKNLVLMQVNSVFETEVGAQKADEVFWNIFSLWKTHYVIPLDKMMSYVEWLESVIDTRIDGIVGGKFRNKYNDAALLAAALGEVKESLGAKMAKGAVISKYVQRYPRHIAFRGALTEYND